MNAYIIRRLVKILDLTESKITFRPSNYAESESNMSFISSQI